MMSTSSRLATCAILLAAAATCSGAEAQQSISCDNVRCGDFTKCEIDAETQRPVCRCPSRCPAYFRYAPICASDGNTYPGTCEIEVAACKAKKNIYYVRDGECAKTTTSRSPRKGGNPKPPPSGPSSNPCSYTKCRAGATCKLVAGRAKCQCAEVCTADYAPVCGTDNKTYPNACELERSACTKQSSLVVAHEGDCDNPNANPCAYTDCVYGATCRVESGKAKCECSTLCTDIYEPVCGSDGKTYGNLCSLEAASCRSQGQISLASQGECSSITKRSTELPPRCKSGCPKSFVPVCGSDGVTYANSCLLEAAACQQQKELTIVKQGKCEDTTCGSVCPQIYQPVCGDDGITYSNTCSLERAACESQSDIQVAYEGVCDEDSCDDGKKRTKRAVRPQCGTVCGLIFQPVCGSDGVTYDNMCLLNNASCRAGYTIRLVGNGPCT